MIRWEYTILGERLMIAPGSMQLEGTLDQFPLDELIELAIGTMVTGVIEIGHGGTVGTIFCRDGRLYHVSTRNHTSFDALCELFGAGDAPFSFVSGITSDTITLWHDPYILVNQAKEQAQLWQHVRQSIHDLNWVPVLLDKSARANVQISESTWPILAVVDGQRSITEMAMVLGQVPLEVCVGLCELQQQGVITFAKRSSTGPQARPVQTTDATFFKRVALANNGSSHSTSF